MVAATAATAAVVGLLVAGAAAAAPAQAAIAPGAAISAAIVPMAAGVAEAPSVVWQDDFENGQSNTPTRLSGYTAAAGTKYTAAPYWADYANCNGVVVNYNVTTWVSQGGVQVCTVEVSAVARRNVQRMADVLGQVGANVVGGTATAPVNGSTADTRKNHAVAEWTTDGGTGTAGQTVAATSGALGVAATSSRYYSASIDVVEASCAYLSGANNSRLNLLLSTGGAERSVTPLAIQACTDTRAANYTSPAPAGSGSNPWDNGGASVRAGRFTASGSVVLTPAELASLGLVVRNATTASDGNDFAIDNLRILDVTPSLDKAFSPTTIVAGATSTLTFTVTNTSELAAKSDMSFTDALPAGLVVATPSAIGGTCTSTTGAARSVTAAAGSGTITVSGIDLAAGATSCTVTVGVTSAQAGTYTNGPANVTTILNAPDPATLTVTAPSTITVRKNVVARSAASDQFVLGLRTATGTTDLATVTTSGSALGVQAAAMTPYAVTPGQTYAIREAMASGSASTLTAYSSTWQCVNGATVLASGTGASGSITVPASTPAGSGIVCTITNTPLTATLTLAATVAFGDAAATSWTLSATGGSGTLPGPSGVTGSAAATAVSVTAGAPYALSAAGGPGTYIPQGGWTCTDQDAKAVTVSADARVTLAPGSTVRCAIVYGTARITLLKNVVTPSAGFTAASWTLTASPAALSGVSLSAQSRVGAEYSAAGNAANTIEVRPGHLYTLSEALTDPNSVVAYRQIALQRLDNGVWVDVESAQVAAPALGQTATYRFVNDRIPATVLPLTGGPSTDAFLLIGAGLLLVTGALVAWQARTRARPRGRRA